MTSSSSSSSRYLWWMKREFARSLWLSSIDSVDTFLTGVTVAVAVAVFVIPTVELLCEDTFAVKADVLCANYFEVVIVSTAFEDDAAAVALPVFTTIVMGCLPARKQKKLTKFWRLISWNLFSITASCLLEKWKKQRRRVVSHWFFLSSSFSSASVSSSFSTFNCYNCCGWSSLNTASFFFFLILGLTSMRS